MVSVPALVRGRQRSGCGRHGNGGNGGLQVTKEALLPRVHDLLASGGTSLLYGLYSDGEKKGLELFVLPIIFLSSALVLLFETFCSTKLH